MTDALKDLDYYAANPDEMPTDPDQIAALMAQMEGTPAPEQAENDATAGVEVTEGEEEKTAAEVEKIQAETLKTRADTASQAMSIAAQGTPAQMTGVPSGQNSTF